MVFLYRLWPTYALAHNNLAAVVNDSSDAEKHVKLALRIDPGHANALFNMALILRSVLCCIFSTLFSPFFERSLLKCRNRGLCSRAVPLLERCIFDEDSNVNDEAKVLLVECLSGLGFGLGRFPYSGIKTVVGIIASRHTKGERSFFPAISLLPLLTLLRLVWASGDSTPLERSW